MIKNKKYLILTSFLIVLSTIILISLFTNQYGTFFASFKNSSNAKVLEYFLEKEKIDFDFNDRDKTFYVNENVNINEIQAKFLSLKKNNIQEIKLLNEKKNEKRKDYLKRYNSKVIDLLSLINPHLKYIFSIKHLSGNFGEINYLVDVEVSDVLSRDNTSIIKQVLRIAYDSIVPLKAVIINDEKKILSQNSYGLTFNSLKLQKDIEKVIKKLLSPIIEIDKSYIVVENKDNDLTIDILIENIDSFNKKEREILVSAIESKISKSIKIEKTLKVSISQISSLSSNSESEIALISSQDSFLYLLFFSTLLLFVYLVASIYFQNKKRFERTAKIQEVQRKENIKIMELEERVILSCEQIEAFVIYKPELTVKLIELFIKNKVGYSSKEFNYNSIQVCAIVIKELEQEARGVIFDGLGTYTVEKIINYATNNNLLIESLETKSSILETFNIYLNEKSSLLNFQQNRNDELGNDSINWKGSHLVELIKNAALQKNAKELAHFFEEENPVFTSLVFVSLSSSIQDEIWKNLSFEHKEKLCLNLVSKANISDQSVKFSYECFKEVS